MCLGENIRFLRNKKGYSQEDIANMLGYKSFTTIQKWESGVSEPPLKALKKLAEIFDVDMNDLATKKISIDINKGNNVYNLISHNIPIEKTNTVNTNTPKILQYYNELNYTGKQEATKRVQELTYLPQYKEENNSELSPYDSVPATAEELEKLYPPLDIKTRKKL